eukprot:CAMPEP_0206461166 /NCGR_PEP_ID=MMETSP0324_2-20121206/25190_1 /ASSEMBLY_ACC=CAM_ASM_000836 /TAXON_ID=2866 /ORGANISM="Crypthecodinium cohnii, Strain Seligo" /LENGTH=96 /DNA_ID=CAMNT_0053933017 /DNA_START=182 /DNA_END=472 /DNA_ORIENTATION=+
MGQDFGRTAQACWDPEGTAAIVRKKKAQRAAINQYSELLSRLEQCQGNAERDGILREIKRVDSEMMSKQEGRFWPGLQEHADWPQIKEKRSALGVV